MDKILDTFLLAYTIPSATVPQQCCPAELFFGRKPWKTLDLLLPTKQQTGLDNKMERQFNRRHGAVERNFDVGISHGTCHKILTEDLKMRHVTSKFVPTLLIVNNAPAHAAVLTRRILTNNNMTMVPHPLYSPDLAPCEFFLFPKMK